MFIRELLNVCSQIFISFWDIFSDKILSVSVLFKIFRSTCYFNSEQNGSGVYMLYVSHYT